MTSIFIARPDVGLMVIKFCIGGHCTNLLKVTYVFPAACDVVLAPNMLDRFFFFFFLIQYGRLNIQPLLNHLKSSL